MEVCVHWVDFPGDPDAPDPTDDDLDGVPNYAELALTTLENVWAQEIGALGYRAPLSDITSNDNGLNAKFDVYLDDLGSDLVYGYCTTDDPNRDSDRDLRRLGLLRPRQRLRPQPVRARRTRRRSSSR